MSINYFKLEDKNILITGASGLIGSYLCEKLSIKNNVIVCERDMLPVSRLTLERLYQKLIVTRGDLKDIDYLKRILFDYDIDIVFHLAAQTQVVNALNNPRETFLTNVVGTLNLLEAARYYNRYVRLIIASSDKAYGELEKLPYEETMDPKPIYPYDVSKRCTELISLSYHHTYGLPICITRLSNVYGGGDFNFQRLIPYVIRSIIKGDTIKLRSDGSPLREYLYVEDAANAYITIAEKFKKANGNIYNVGSNEVFSVLEVIKIISEMMGYKKQPLLGKKNNKEIEKQYLSSKKIESELNWKAEYKFSEGIKKTIDWYLHYKDFLF
ncbi:MAG: GDP-mannose 4,6-dehydratase [Candidatus Anstonellales archaeon]